MTDSLSIFLKVVILLSFIIIKYYAKILFAKHAVYRNMYMSEIPILVGMMALPISDL